MINVTESAKEEELEELFENFQKVTYVRIPLVEMSHSQLPTPVETDNTAGNIIVNGTGKQKKIHSNSHDILLGKKQIMTIFFQHIMGGRKEKTCWIMSQYTTQYGTTEL